MIKRKFIFSIILILGTVSLWAWEKGYIDIIKTYVIVRLKGKRTLKEVMTSLEAKYNQNKFIHLRDIQVNQVKKLQLLAFKKEKIMEVWIKQKQQPWQYQYSIAIKGDSGKLGPKFAEGDKQIPEGIYPLTYLNPNSMFHVSIKIGYPNKDDIKRSLQRGVEDFGGDIYIHSTSATIGCLALGELSNVEELFFLCGKIGLPNCKIIISPIDFRTGKNCILQKDYPGFYRKLKTKLKTFSR